MKERGRVEERKSERTRRVGSCEMMCYCGQEDVGWRARSSRYPVVVGHRAAPPAPKVVYDDDQRTGPRVFDEPAGSSSSSSSSPLVATRLASVTVSETHTHTHN